MKVINAISRSMSYIGVGLIVILMLLTVANVIARFIFSNPIIGTAEITEMMMASLVLGVSWCALKGRHIFIDMVVVHFPKRLQAISGSITLLCALGIFIIIAWRGFEESLWALRSKFVASILMPIPKFPIWWLYVLGLTMLCIVLVILLVQKIKEAGKG